MLIEINVETIPVSPDDLVDGETIYYTTHRGIAGHGPFTVKILEGGTHLENRQGVQIPLSKFRNVHLCRLRNAHQIVGP